MGRTVVLRFRDLVTEPGGTIEEHTRVLQAEGEVWWGWWMKQYEAIPHGLFGELAHDDDTSRPCYLFNSGTGQVYECRIEDVHVAPDKDHPIPTPDPSKTPAYYVRGRYRAWFLLSEIRETSFDNLSLRYESFPTSKGYPDLLGHPIGSVEQLRNMDITLWVVNEG